MSDRDVMGLAHTAVQQTLLGDAAEHSGMGMLVWNAERRYVAANPRACELVGATREELLSRRVGATNGRDEAEDAIAAILAKAPASGNTPITRSDGSELDLQWLVFPTTLAGLPHIVGFFWDATEV